MKVIFQKIPAFVNDSMTSDDNISSESDIVQQWLHSARNGRQDNQVTGCEPKLKILQQLSIYLSLYQQMWYIQFEPNRKNMPSDVSSAKLEDCNMVLRDIMSEAQKQ